MKNEKVGQNISLNQFTKYEVDFTEVLLNSSESNCSVEKLKKFSHQIFFRQINSLF